MSTPNPFPQEEQGQLERMPLWNPESAQPRWYDGFGFNEDTAYLGPFYRVLEAAGNGAAKGEAMLAGIWHAEYAALSHVPGLKTVSQEMASETADMQADARDRVRATTPDPATTGAAVQTVHGVVSGAYRAMIGGFAGGPVGGAAAIGGSEAVNRFEDLEERGVDTGTAAASAGLAGVTSGVGALLPGGWGSSLFSRVLTGAGANVGMGLAGRYADHQLLEAAGYHDMAEQQAVWDGTQLVADTLLGAAFGGLAHVHAAGEAKAEAARQAWLKSLPAWGQASGALDAARTLQVGLRDRAAAPGVPVDPAAAQAHQVALEKATSDLLTGQPVNVADTGIHGAEFLARDNPNAQLGEKVIANAFRESGILDEEQNLKELEEALAGRLRGEKPAERVQTSAQPESVTSEAPAPDAGYTVAEEELTDEQRQAFKRLQHPHGEVVPPTVGGSGAAEEGRPGNDEGRGGIGSAGEPTRVYRGGRGGPLTSEHFSSSTLGRATGHPSSGLGVFFTSDAGDAAHYGAVTEHDLTLQNPKHIPIEDLPGFDTLAEATAFREQLHGEGHDGIVIDASHLGGPKHFVAFEPHGVASAGEPRELPRLQRDPELRAGLQAMKGETGWAQVGGRITRDPDSEQVIGRTSWIPHADWWPGRPKGLTEKQIHAAVDKALAGQPLSKRESAMVDFMTQVHDERVKMAETHAALQEAVPDLAEQPREAVDLTVLVSRAAEHDEEAVGQVLDSWKDDHPETIARVRGELEQIIGRGQETLKAEADRGREPAQAQRAPAPGGDLFGQDTRAAQALADETRRRDLLRSPNQDVPLETGRPDDLFSQSRRQIDIADTLADHADLQIADENGKPTSAAAALHEADTATAQGEQEAPKATEAAVNCFLRKGN